MYQTLSTKDVDVNARIAMFSKVDDEKKKEDKDKERAIKDGKRNRTEKLQNDLRVAKEERDRLLGELNEYVCDTKTPLESLRRTDFQLYHKLQDKEDVQKGIKLEFELQRIRDENRKLEAELEELKSSGRRKSTPNTGIGNVHGRGTIKAKVEDDRNVEVLNPETSQHLQEEMTLWEVKDPKEDYIFETKNSDQKKEQNEKTKQSNVKKKYEQKDDRQEPVTKAEEHTRERDTNNKPKIINKDEKETNISNTENKAEPITTDEKYTRWVDTENRSESDKTKQQQDQKYDTLQSILRKPENLVLVNPEDDESKWLSTEQVENKAKQDGNKKGDKKKRKSKENESNAEKSEPSQNMPQAFGEMKVPQDTLYKILHDEANVAAINIEVDTKTKKQQGERHDSLQSILGKPENLALMDTEDAESKWLSTADEESKARQDGDKKRDKKKRKSKENNRNTEKTESSEPCSENEIHKDTLYRLLESDIAKAKSESENENKQTDIPENRSEDVQSEAEKLTHVESEKPRDNEKELLEYTDLQKANEEIARLRKEIKENKEKEEKEISELQAQLKQDQEKYKALRKKYKEKKDELQRLKSELQTANKKNEN